MNHTQRAILGWALILAGFASFSLLVIGATQGTDIKDSEGLGLRVSAKVNT